MMKRRELIGRITKATTGVYESWEAKAIAFAVVEGLYGLGRTAVIAEPEADIEDYDERVVAAVCTRLAAGEPLQYVLGRTEFCGLVIDVAKGVLIPRPETEELVGWICRDYSGHKQPLRILDIGTGSGAIAIALAGSLPDAEVVALDISAEALAIAAANAERNGVEVDFVPADILASAEDAEYAAKYDIIVSNPPYIPLGERDSMRTNVKDYEPAGALFVSDGDPLLFYREIGIKAFVWLSVGGALYFEVHESYADEVCELMRSQGFSDVECRADINDKPRMVKCLKM